MNIAPKPSNVKWTDDQWKAIMASGKDILVAAAAGSGKTAVLVERIIQKLLSEENPTDVDRLLIVTFTNAAAQEMKNRIGEAIEAELKKDPASPYLRKQLLLLNRASISTLHSFCLDVIRRYYYLVNLDPQFRIGNETEIQLIIEEIMEDLLEEQYGSEHPEAFFELVDSYTSDRSDTEIQSIILKLFYDSRAHPSPNKWLTHLVESYHIEGKEIEEISYFQIVLQDVKRRFEGMEEKMQGALQLADSMPGLEKRAVLFKEELTFIQSILAATNSWEQVSEQIKNVTFKRLPVANKKENPDEAIAKRTQAIRDEVKDEINTIKDAYFTRSSARYIEDLLKIKEHIGLFVSLVQEFSIRFEQAKREKGMVDFSDLEHYCLRILGENEAVAANYKEKFAEVMVDEYQDTNDVQESILSFVTKTEANAGNMFMVGDVKQSIYGFRLAEPKLFLNKYKRYDTEGKGEGIRIDLNQNFRSRQEVLDATNFIFKQVMDENVGEIHYDDAAELKLGNLDYLESQLVDAELLLINKGSVVETTEEVDETAIEQAELENVQMEARLIAGKIHALIAQKFEVYDKEIKCNRPLMYRDCVILLRSMPWAEQIMEEFKKAGIPLYAELSGGYLEATEIAVMLNLLRIIDNPNQDIPLASVLRSPIVGLTDSDLAVIRIEYGKGSFYELVYKYGQKGTENSKKVSAFLKQLKKWREEAQQKPLGEFIWSLLRETGYYDFVGGLAGGKQRQANLRMLYDRARQFEQTSFRGLYRFLRFIERLEERGEDLAAAKIMNEQENVVRLMTIHKSKGLEFPVVFVAGLGRNFNMQDLRGKYLLHREYGFGGKYINPHLRITYPSIAYHAIGIVKKAEVIAEEMRVLYVALTRAKEKLYLVGTDKIEQKIAKWQTIADASSWVLPDSIRSSAKCYLDWIGPALIRHQHGVTLTDGCVASPSYVNTHPAKFTMQVVDSSQLILNVEEENEQNQRLAAVRAGEEVEVATEWKEEIEGRLTWCYPHQASTVHPAKQSVSQLKRLSQKMEQQEGSFSFTRQNITLARPQFMEKRVISASERGTAVHTVMQHLDLTKELQANDVVEALARMVNRELITQEESDSISIESIVQFSQSELGSRIRYANKIHKELQFAMMIDGKQIAPSLEGEEIFVQGIMDCVVEEGDDLVLIDYKTDSMFLLEKKSKEEREAILRERYATQLALYKQALQKILNRNVKESILYFFDGSQIISM